MQILIFFFFFNCNPPEKSYPPLSQQPGSKNWGPVKLPPSGKFGRITTPPQQKGGMHTVVCSNALIYYYFTFSMRKIFCLLCFDNVFVFALLLLILRFLYVKLLDKLAELVGSFSKSSVSFFKGKLNWDSNF